MHIWELWRNVGFDYGDIWADYFYLATTARDRELLTNNNVFALRYIAFGERTQIITTNKWM
jgi:hypothetical protein